MKIVKDIDTGLTRGFQRGERYNRRVCLFGYDSVVLVPVSAVRQRDAENWTEGLASP